MDTISDDLTSKQSECILTFTHKLIDEMKLHVPV